MSEESSFISQVSVASANGDTIWGPCDVDGADLVSSLLLQVAQKAGVRQDRARLIFGEKRLMLEDSLTFSGLVSNACLTLAVETLPNESSLAGLYAAVPCTFLALYPGGKGAQKKRNDTYWDMDNYVNLCGTLANFRDALSSAALTLKDGSGWVIESSLEPGVRFCGLIADRRIAAGSRVQYVWVGDEEEYKFFPRGDARYHSLPPLTMDEIQAKCAEGAEHGHPGELSWDVPVKVGMVKDDAFCLKTVCLKKSRPPPPEKCHADSKWSLVDGRLVMEIAECGKIGTVNAEIVCIPMASHHGLDDFVLDVAFPSKSGDVSIERFFRVRELEQLPSRPDGQAMGKVVRARKAGCGKGKDSTEEYSEPAKGKGEKGKGKNKGKDMYSDEPPKGRGKNGKGKGTGKMDDWYYSEPAKSKGKKGKDKGTGKRSDDVYFYEEPQGKPKGKSKSKGKGKWQGSSDISFE